MLSEVPIVDCALSGEVGFSTSRSRICGADLFYILNVGLCRGRSIKMRERGRRETRSAYRATAPLSLP